MLQSLLAVCRQVEASVEWISEQSQQITSSRLTNCARQWFAEVPCTRRTLDSAVQESAACWVRNPCRSEPLHGLASSHGGSWTGQMDVAGITSHRGLFRLPRHRTTHARHTICLCRVSQSFLIPVHQIRSFHAAARPSDAPAACTTRCRLGLIDGACPMWLCPLACSQTGKENICF